MTKKQNEYMQNKKKAQTALVLFFGLLGVPSAGDLDGLTAAAHRRRHSLRKNSQAIYEEPERWKR